jgi:hypothetical protein
VFRIRSLRGALTTVVTSSFTFTARVDRVRNPRDGAPGFPRHSSRTAGKITMGLCAS